MLILYRLINEAAIEAKQAKDKNITARHIRKIQNVSFLVIFRIGYLSLACVLNFMQSMSSRNSVHEPQVVWRVIHYGPF